MKRKTKIIVGVLSLLLISGCGMGIGKVLVLGVQVIHGIGHLLDADESDDDKKTEVPESD